MQNNYRKLKNILKDTFIPHQKNDYKPHFFREHIMLTLLIATLLLLLLSYTAHTILRNTVFGSRVVASVIIDLTNETRLNHNLHPLLPNQKLIEAAKLKGEDMASREYFSHFAPDGTSPWYWIKQAGYRFMYAGENLAVNFTNSQEVERAWLESKKHRDNILSPHYEDIGVAIVSSKHITPPALFVVQFFGKEANSNQVSKKSPPVWHAHLYEKILFNSPNYIRLMYIFLLIVVSVSLILMIGIEFKKQHYLHIGYGAILAVIIILCVIINSFFL